MEYQQDGNTGNSSQPAIVGLTESPGGGNYPANPPKKISAWKVIWMIFSVLSVMANVIFFFSLVGIIILLATGQTATFNEETLREGPVSEKIALVSLNGILYDEQADLIQEQLKSVKKDKSIKAVIIQINSPGGTISASDRIHNEISRFRDNTSMPVIAFMQGVAASGGYYSAVACEKIIAEPTTITGSIGVISEYFVFQELLEKKLGVLPVVIKSGQKKDWPSSFRQPDEEELKYIQDKLIAPALTRFINIVAEGRKDVLTLEDVTRLADGSIFEASEAAKEKLIDSVGYLDDAIELVKTMAGLKKARVVLYRRPFSFSDLLGVSTQSLFKLDKSTIYELSTPQRLYLWSAY
jgi:protease IV